MKETDVVTKDEMLEDKRDEHSQSSYEVCGQALAKLIEALMSEASKIDGIGDDFRQMDEELSLLVKLVTE